MNQLRVPGVLPVVAESTLARLADALVTPGYGHFPELLHPEWIRALREEAESLRDCGSFRKARVGRLATRSPRPELRTDQIVWLEPAAATPMQVLWLDFMEGLREYLRHRLLLPLTDFEGHLARYEAGGFYRPHLDQHRDSAARQVTVIAYLNGPAWDPDDGGQLRLYTDTCLGISGPSIDILPMAGTLVCFRSADFWHEVLPARCPRYSLTGWLRTRSELPAL